MATNGEVFIVDDDPLVLKSLAIFLVREGYRVTGFTDGESFLAAARLRTPVCVILARRDPAAQVQGY